MPWRGEQYPGEFPSLGWAIADLIEANLRVPSGMAYGHPLVLTDEQLAFIVKLYRIDSDTGRPVYRRGVLERPKGWGKSPLLGALAFAELVGPVIFDGWDANGEPVGKPWPTPWVQIAAVSEDQTDNTYAQLVQALAESPAVDEWPLDIGKGRIFLTGKGKEIPGRIEPVTTSAGAREGQPVTFAVEDETHLWVPSRKGDQLDAVLGRNVGKMGGRRVESTNAYRRGQDSVAEKSAAAAAKRAKGLLYDARPGDFVEDLTDRELLLPALAKAYGDSSWVDLERIYEECNDPGVLPSDARRFYLSIPADEAEDECWLDPGMWEACEHYAVQLDPNGGPVFLGVDVSLRGDTTAVVAAQRQDELWTVAAHIWDPNETGTIDLEEVEAYIKAMASRFKVAGVAYDPKFFARSAQLLEQDGVVMVEVPQSHERMVPACGQAKHLIQTGQVAHPGDIALTTQVLAAVPKFTESGWRLQKAKSRRKIDAAIALVLALDLASALGAPAHEPWVMYA
jgi:hypothetical protein